MATSFIQKQNEIREDYIEEDIIPPRPLWREILSSKVTQGIFFVFLFAALIPVLVYFFIVDEGKRQDPFIRTCSVDTKYRIQCGLVNATIQYCDSINCCHDNATQTCYHFLPSHYYYSRDEKTKKFQRSLDKTPWGNAMDESVAITIQDLDENRVKIILHKDSDEIQDIHLDQKNYNTKKFDDPLVAEVYRGNDSDEVLLTSSKGPLIVSENYWEWSIHLGDDYLFGLGETLLQIPINTTLTKVVYSNAKDHTTLPIFMSFKNDNFHGVTIVHSGPLEITILPSNLISLKWLIGSRIELEVSVGPTPKDVMTQQELATGENGTVLEPSSWLLGFHVCRSGSNTNLEQILKEYNDFLTDNPDLQYESDCIHENYFLALLQKSPDERKRLIAESRGTADSSSKTFILNLPPQIPNGTDLFQKLPIDVFYKDADGELFSGKYLNQDVAFPQFTHTNIEEYLNTLINYLSETLELSPNYLTLQDNWPVNNIEDMAHPEAPYLSQNLLEAISQTIPWDLKSADNVSHWEDHNSYGALQTQLITQHLKSLDPALDVLIMTSSHNSQTFQPVIMQNVDISWPNFRKSIQTILYNSVFGGRMVAIPTCGTTAAYDSKLHESLCIRWYLMAATSPIFRVSSDLPRRDPNSLSSEYAKRIVKRAITIRNQLKQYMFTNWKIDKDPFMRPMFYDFPTDKNTYGLYSQYMFGKSMLVAHPVFPNVRQIQIYLPPQAGVWYELWGGTSYNVSDTADGWILFDVVESDWISFLKGGTIVPFISSSENETILTLTIGCLEKGGECEADGRVIIQENEILDFKCSKDGLTISGITLNAKNEMGCSSEVSYEIQKLNIYGLGDDIQVLQNIDVNVNLCASDDNITIPFNNA